MLSKISASGIGELLTGGKTAESYLLKKAMECLGIKDELHTRPMEHGLLNQFEAYELVVAKLDNAKWHDVYTPINDYCGASADAVGDSFVFDVKCPYYVDTYLEQRAKLPKKYMLQSQMQMLAEGKERGAIVLYLTNSEIDLYGNKIEYPYPLEDRYYIHELSRDEQITSDILITAESGHKKMLEWVEILTAAPEKESGEFFYDQIIGTSVYRKLKTASSIENTIKKAFKQNNEYYYEIR